MNIDFENLIKANAMSVPFNGIIDDISCAKENAARVSKADMLSISEDDEKHIKLRQKLASLFHEKADGSYSKLEADTYIRQNTMQTWLSGKRKAGREKLALFVIGLKVDLETADELFSLQSHPLNMNNRFDYIVACALKDGDDKEQFGDDIMGYCNIDIFKN